MNSFGFFIGIYKLYIYKPLILYAHNGIVSHRTLSIIIEYFLSIT
jgi:hypothetical protein